MSDRLISAEDSGHVLDDASVRVRTHLWYVWAEVAMEQEWLATRARADFGSRRVEDSSGRDIDLEVEVKASMLAVAAVTHALDALQGDLAEMGAVPDEVLAKWRKRGPKNHTLVHQTLSGAFGSEGFDSSLSARLEQTYTLRNEVLHQRPAWGPLAVHPALGMRTTPAAARYTLERARQAVDLLIHVLQAAILEREGRAEAGTAWARTWRTSVPVLVAQRLAEPSWLGLVGEA